MGSHFAGCASRLGGLEEYLQAENSKLLLVVHTYLEIDTNAANVRIISARPATKHEQRQYEADT